MSARSGFMCSYILWQLCTLFRLSFRARASLSGSSIVAFFACVTGTFCSMYALADYKVKWWGICANCKGGPSEGRCPLRRCAHCLQLMCKQCDEAFDDYPGDLIRCCIHDTIWDVYRPFAWEKDYTPGAVLLKASATRSEMTISDRAMSTWLGAGNQERGVVSPISALVLGSYEDVGEGKGGDRRSQLLQTP